MKPTAAMIFAAGLGTRMGVLTSDRPKPLIEVGGRPLLAYALELVRDAGVSRIVVNLHAHAEMLHAFLRAHAPDVLTSYEPVLRETGGGLRQALPQLGDGPVYTINSDMIWKGTNPLRALNEEWDATDMDALLAVIPVEKAQGHSSKGDFFLDRNAALSRRGIAPKADYVYSGAQIIDPKLLGSISENTFSLNRVWDVGLSVKSVKGTVYGGSWVDVGRPDGIALAETLLAQ